MKLMSLQQYLKLSKASLIRKIVKTLKKMPKKKLAVLCYNLQKSKLPTFTMSHYVEGVDVIERRKIPRLTETRRADTPKRTKRKARFRKGSPEAKRHMARLRARRKRR